jgi:hypothetical protein
VSIILQVYKRAINQIVVFKEAYKFYLLHTKFYPTSCYQGGAHMHQCGLRRSRSPTDHVFCIRQIL